MCRPPELQLWTSVLIATSASALFGDRPCRHAGPLCFATPSIYVTRFRCGLCGADSSSRPTELGNIVRKTGNSLAAITKEAAATRSR